MPYELEAGYCLCVFCLFQLMRFRQCDRNLLPYFKEELTWIYFYSRSGQSPAALWSVQLICVSEMFSWPWGMWCCRGLINGWKLQAQIRCCLLCVSDQRSWPKALDVKLLHFGFGTCCFWKSRSRSSASEQMDSLLFVSWFIYAFHYVLIWLFHERFELLRRLQVLWVKLCRS